MTNTAAPTSTEWLSIQLTNGDRTGMDAGELREHLGHYVAANGGTWDYYAARVASHLHDLLDDEGYSEADLQADIEADAEYLASIA